jgi:hypothetical protein
LGRKRPKTERRGVLQLARRVPNYDGVERGPSAGSGPPSAGLLHAALIGWAALRALALMPATMHAWGLNFGRTVPLPVLVACGSLLALGLVPALARPLADLLAPRPGRRGPARSSALWLAVVAVGLVWLLPDRTGFVGDALMRLGVLGEPASAWSGFPQAMPLDRILHHASLRWLAERTPVAPEGWARVLGAGEAALLAWLAVRFASGLGLAGAARVGIACTLLFGGYLALFTGYGKPTVEVVLCTIAAGVFGLEVVRDGRGALPFALAVSLGVLLHRAALPLVPVWVAVAALDWRRRGFPRWHRALLAHGLPVVVLLALAPRLVSVFMGFDLPGNVTSREFAARGGVLRVAFSGMRLLDIANLLLMHAPLLPVALIALPGVRGRRTAAAEWVVIGTLLLAFAPLLLFFYGAYGPFRDWDAYGGAGAAVALAVSYVLARALGREPGRAWLGVPLALSAVMPVVLILVSQAGLDDGLQRVHHFLDEPPARATSWRETTIDFIGTRCMREARWGEAAETYERLSALAPSPRVLLFWGTSAAIAGQDASAERAFLRLTERVPEDPLGWFGLWLMAGAGGDSALARRAWGVVRTWAPGSQERGQVTRYLDHYPEMAQRLPRRRGRGTVRE